MIRKLEELKYTLKIKIENAKEGMFELTRNDIRVEAMNDGDWKDLWTGTIGEGDLPAEGREERKKLDCWISKVRPRFYERTLLYVSLATPQSAYGSVPSFNAGFERRRRSER